MPIRFRRRRLLIFVVFTMIYFVNYYLNSGEENVVKRLSTVSIVHEQIVEIDGKQLKKIDWHDYTSIIRTGLGEDGVGVELSFEERNNPKFQQLYEENGFNAFASDRISLDRSVKDVRHPKCKTKLYLAELPSVSIIIPIHDAHLTTLLRSIHSILNGTPEKLLQEIILVNDASSQVMNSISNLTKTRIIRLEKREGLIRARLAGARVANGDILIFLDSYIEVNTNWLPPLIEPIVLNYKTSVCPFIDIVKSENFEYISRDEGARGVFDWSMNYRRLPLLSAQLENPVEPFETPVMDGRLFAIHKKWFWELGGYDEGLEFFGGEQYEISFKIWQCGGRMLDAPCSRVGHIYRQLIPHGDSTSKNHKRIATIWMDEYAKFIYKQNPVIRDTNPGDIQQQIQLREKLQCKSFKWFMENVAHDLPQYYPPVPLPSFAEGEIRSMAAALCIDTKHGLEQAEFGLDQCLKDQQGRTGEQEFELTWRQDIRPKGRELCFDVSQQGKRASVTLIHCHGMQGNQQFIYDLKHYHILHVASQLCLDCDLNSKLIYMEQCDIQSLNQKWKFSSYNDTLILKEMKQFFSK